MFFSNQITYVECIRLKGLRMKAKKVIKSQYRASLAMLRQAIEKCPDSHWQDMTYRNSFWYVAYHALYFTHLYLQPTEDDLVSWEKDPEKIVSFTDRAKVEAAVFSKLDILSYLDFCLVQVEEQVEALNLEADSGFHWLPFNKLELQFYNIRHIMQHTGELCERLGAHGEIEVGWVGRG